MTDSGITVCAAGTSRYAPTEDELRTAQVILNQMEGMKALLNGDEAAFEQKMNHATTLEDLTDYPTGPPSIAQPSFEQYGEWLIAKGRYEEATKQFEKALTRMPRRAKSLEGKLKALRALDESQEAVKIQNELESIYAQADTEVRSFLEE